ncbi:MAG: hypothetical protein HW397_475, partial [Dehalococcoidia bacterium]|nr:hypothetical protein [Dehalococcoidia bacterium]
MEAQKTLQARPAGGYQLMIRDLPEVERPRERLLLY